jgi:threonyl-tRNA synthetase
VYLGDLCKIPLFFILSPLFYLRMSQSPDQLYNIRHSFAHVLAQAVLELWPNAKLTIGPPVDNGCYYDFLFATPISPDDFKAIEEKMRSIINKGQTFAVESLPIQEAIAYWNGKEQPFKVELVEDLAKEGVTEVTHYKNLDVEGNEKFVDLCKGGHVENLKELPADGFKIMSLAGAYWRGDEKREQLTRIYVAAFASKEDLKAYLTMLEEAKKRDHRKLGQELDLFTFSELVGPGLPLWTTRGTLLRNLLDNFVWELRSARGYEKVTIPHITKKELYETSGHWAKFSDELFKVQSREGHEFAMKPMNCPHHTQIYACRARSYRDLPQRYSETTTCYRDEQTGELHGLSRVRAFTQDDAHVFCRLNQVKEEFFRIWDIIDTFYTTLGFDTLQVRLSLHDPNAFENYLGTKEIWNTAENSLREIAAERGVQYIEALGEAAFYGPKVDFMTKDAIGRTWQVATIQLDVNMPERFDLTCTNEQGEPERIVMIHAAIMGSLERFFSIYLEHIAGVFPVWLAPIQVCTMPIAEAHIGYTAIVEQKLREAGIRFESTDTADSLGKRVRTSQKSKIPYSVILGDAESRDQTVTVRMYGSEEQSTLPLHEFIEKISEKVATRALGYTVL